jgi:hypothetical protein
MTARPSSGYQTGAPALLRAAQDVVKEGKGRDPVGPRPALGSSKALEKKAEETLPETPAPRKDGSKGLGSRRNLPPSRVSLLLR